MYSYINIDICLNTPHTTYELKITVLLMLLEMSVLRREYVHVSLHKT